MIFAFTGKTGSGKTLTMVNCVYPRWLKGRTIYSNIELNFDIDLKRKFFNKCKYYIAKIKKKPYKPIQGGKIFYFSDLDDVKHVKNAIILLDEGQEFLHAYDWKNNDREFIRKLRMQRKQGLDVYTTSQNIGSIDINYRRLVQALWYCKGRYHTPLTYHYLIEKKEIYELSNKNVDDLTIATREKEKKILFKKLSKKYNTLEEVSSNRLKIICLNFGKKQKAFVIPKAIKLSQAIRSINLVKGQFK